MQKRGRILLLALVLLALAVGLWLYGYPPGRNSGRLPSLAQVAGMEEAELNRQLAGYRRQQLAEVWGTPDRSDREADSWQLDGGLMLTVNYRPNDDRVVICGLSLPLLPDETESVTVIHSVNGSDGAPRALQPEEIRAVRDWAAGLDLERLAFAEGEAPNEVYAGGESYLFTVDEGETVFCYLFIDADYILFADSWYRVQNPSAPPIAV